MNKRLLSLFVGGFFWVFAGSVSAQPSLSELEKQASEGNVEAMFHLGQTYDEGRSVPQDYVRALDWYYRAADRGSVDALYRLGVMFEKGLGVPQNLPQAMMWYEQASALGSANAQFSSASCTTLGVGCPRTTARLGNTIG